MERLTLSYPKKMDEAVPANLYAGLAPGARPKPQGPGHVAEVMHGLGRQDAGEDLGAGI